MHGTRAVRALSVTVGWHPAGIGRQPGREQGHAEPSLRACGEVLRGPQFGEVLTSGPLACGVRPLPGMRASLHQQPSSMHPPVGSQVYPGSSLGTREPRHSTSVPVTTLSRPEVLTKRDQERGPHTHTGPQRATLFTPPPSALSDHHGRSQGKQERATARGRRASPRTSSHRVRPSQRVERGKRVDSHGGK